MSKPLGPPPCDVRCDATLLIQARFPKFIRGFSLNRSEPESLDRIRYRSSTLGRETCVAQFGTSRSRPSLVRVRYVYDKPGNRDFLELLDHRRISKLQFLQHQVRVRIPPSPPESMISPQCRLASRIPLAGLLPTPSAWVINPKVDFDSHSTPITRFQGFPKALSSATRALLLTT
jgi:hypothetical protein